MNTATTSAADLTADLVATMPQATSAAPAATPAPSTASVTAERDTLGRAFDPAKFRPEKDSVGRWKNLKGGRPPSAGVKSPRTKQAGAPAASYIGADPTPPPAAPPPDRYALGAATIIGLFQAGLISLGQEEGVLTDAEKVAVADPLEKVLRKHDAGDMPPELALAIAAASIVLPRLAKPKTQTSIQKIRGWLLSKFAAFKGERIARAVHEETAAPASA